MHYTLHMNVAFLGVKHIMRNVKVGWLLRYMHANGATAGAIPIVGDTIDSNLALGRLDNATLNRFSSLHYLLPFIIVGGSILHPAASRYGSNNPLGITSSVDEIVFLPIFM
jgi:quinol-cytochrome oxidoreductase complex cytochrome b subunit